MHGVHEAVLFFLLTQYYTTDFQKNTEVRVEFIKYFHLRQLAGGGICLLFVHRNCKAVVIVWKLYHYSQKNLSGRILFS